MSSWPCGQVHGAEDSAIGRFSSNVSPQARQRYSYRGTPPVYAPGAASVSRLAGAGFPLVTPGAAADGRPAPFGTVVAGLAAGGTSW